MTVFKYFFKILKKYKGIIITYTLMLVFFGGFTLQTSDNSTNFVATKPDVLIINKDEEQGITNHLIKYVKEKATIKDIEQNEEAVSDALFYRDVNYIIYIPENYNKDFMEGKNPEIEIKSTGDYQASYMEMLLSEYLKTANIYQKEIKNEQELFEKIDNTINQNIEVEITSNIDTDSLSQATFFYNFSNYSILAGCVYVIAIVMASFKEKNIKKRTVISSMKNNKYNRELFLANSVFAITLWALYVLVSVILIKDTMFTSYGILYIINSFIFTICSLSIAFLIGNLMTNKNAINGIVNVVALGTSFLCGAFVPVQWLPDIVLKIAHIFPSYWYIQNNEIIATLEVINIETLKPFFINVGVLALFIVGFIIITNLISIKKRKID